MAEKAKNIEVYFTNGEVVFIAADSVKEAKFSSGSLAVDFKDGRETVFPYANILRIESV